ncbi:MAG TPA: S8 family serine peptidase [Tepidisphaeraceae bacterium]|nr:S8 family serine peptidase [Tepidisphaeraceae bacterium]
MTRSNRSPMPLIELLELRVLFAVHNDSFDVTDLTQLRSDPNFSAIDGSGVGIAVLDTGVYDQNPDLNSNVVGWYNAVTTQPNATLTSANDPSNAFDHQGHGSHTSGIAASSNPAIGVAFHAHLIDIRVFADQGEAQLGGDPILRGLEWVALHANDPQYNIKVVNMSLGFGGVNANTVTSQYAQQDETREINTLQSMGITVVTSSGNSYANDPVPGASFPAIVSTISVANTYADNGQPSDFGIPYGGSGDQFYAVEYHAQPDLIAATSQRSSLPNQVAAPGQDIYSTWNGTASADNSSDPNHKLDSGTSMAAPFVAGTVALMQQAAKMFGGQYFSNPQEILQILKDTADTITDFNVADNGRVAASGNTLLPLPETGLQFQRINVLHAIERVKQLVQQGNPTPNPNNGADTDSVTANATSLGNLDGTQVLGAGGNIGADGSVNVGANDIDLYQMNVTSIGNFTIQLSLPNGGTAFGAALRLFDSTGVEIAHSTATGGVYPSLSTDPNSPLPVGVYYVGVSATNNLSYDVNTGAGATGGTTVGDYTLSIGLQNPDPNGVAAGAVDANLTLPDVIGPATNTPALKFTGTLGSDPGPVAGGPRISVPNGDVDMFRVIAPDNGDLVVDTEALGVYGADAADTYVRVFDSNLNQIAFNDDKQPGVNTDSFVSAPVSIGQTYYVAVTNFANADFDPQNPYNRAAGSTTPEQSYDLYLSFDNGDINGTVFGAVAESVGNAVQGTVGADQGVPLIGANGGFKDVDFLQYTPTASGLLDFAAGSASTGFQPSIALWQFGSDNSSIVQVAQTTSTNPALIYPVTANQELFLSVTGSGNQNFNWFAPASGTGGQTGNYTLNTSVLPSSDMSTLSDNAINDTPTNIALGQSIVANLSMDNALVVGDTDVDIYKFVAPTSLHVTIRTNTSQEGSADTVLRVFDASGNPLASNDNADPNGTASAIALDVTAGTTYYIGVSGAGANAMSYDPVTGANAGSGSTGNYSIAIFAPAFVAAASPVSEPLPGTTATETFTVTLAEPQSASATVDYATADGTAVAGADYDAVSGTLTFAPGETTKMIPVTVHGDLLSNADKTFTLNLTNPSAGTTVSTPSVTATITNVAVTETDFGGNKSATYTDSTGHRVLMRLVGPGNGQIFFAGGSADPAQVNVTNTTGASTLVVAASNGATTLPGLSVDGSLAALVATTANITGNVHITGTAGRIFLGNVSGGSITIDGASAAGSTIRLGAVVDSSLTTASPIAALILTSWTDTGGSADTITAPSIAVLRSLGAFNAGLNVSGGDLRIAQFLGGITGGTWAVSGSAATLVAKNTAAGWSATFGGSVGVFVSQGNASGSLTAQSIRLMRVAGNLAQANITLSGGGTSLGTLVVVGVDSASHVTTAGNISVVSVGAMTDGSVEAGVDPAVTGLPISTTAFTTPASIGVFAVTGAAPSPLAFADSIIAAEDLGKVIVRRVLFDNNATPFGFASRSLALFADFENGKAPVVWTPKKPASDLTFAGDFKVSLL